MTEFAPKVTVETMRALHGASGSTVLLYLAIHSQSLTARRLDRAALCDRAGCSRRTFFTSVADLESRGLVERDGAGWRTTSAGSRTNSAGSRTAESERIRTNSAKVRTDSAGSRTPVSAGSRTQKCEGSHSGVQDLALCPYTDLSDVSDRSTARASTPVTVPTEMARRDRERPDVDVMRVWCDAWETATGKRPITPHVYRAHLERFALWVVDAKQPTTLDERDQWTRAAVDVVTANPWARREAYAPRCVAKLLRDGDVQCALDAMSAPGVRSQPTKPTKTTTETYEETNPFAGIDIADLANDWGETMDLGD